MSFPSDLQYARSDEWVRMEDGVATIGITDYAQHELGEIVYLELPEVGSSVTMGTSFGVVESVKAVSELMSPVSGEVLESNVSATDEPSVVNDSAYQNGWMLRVRVTEQSSDLMNAEAYAAFRGE